MSDQKLNINVSVADRPYRLKVSPEEEAEVRLAAKKINDRIMEFQQSYHANDKQDYLAMVALLMATENIQNKKKESATISKELVSKIEEVETKLTAAIAN